MADVLSQSEIDALLAALSSGEIKPEELAKDEETQKVKIYNFDNPQRFSKDHIRTLELIHDNYSRIISNYLSAQLRTNVKIKIESIEQNTYEEFIHSVPNPTILTIFTMAPLNGSILFETNPQFVFQIVDILLGGAGSRTYKNREFTDIDKNIITYINKGLIQNLKLAWDEILEVEPKVESIETNPALNQTMAPNEPVLLITFSVEIGRNNTFINMCIPYLCVENIMDKLLAQYWFKEQDQKLVDESRVKMKERINIVDVSIKAELGKSNITVDEFLKLNIGDVVRLNNGIKNPIKIYVEDEETFWAKPGTIGKNVGVQILDIIDKDVENNE